MEFRVGVGEWWVDFFIMFLTQRRRDAEYAEGFKLPSAGFVLLWGLSARFLATKITKFT